MAPSDGDPVTGGVAAWVDSGLAALTGRPDGPPLRPPTATITAIADLVAAAPGPDPLALLGERAARAGLGRGGAVSCGGGTRLLPTADGWVAVNLARPDDVAAVAAWLELEADPVDPWAVVAAVVRSRPVAGLVERAVLLGLAVAAVADQPRSTEPIRRRRRGDRPPLAHPPLVVDLGSLWAGPLCTHLLQLRGARVVKVEAIGRPDGGRDDPSGFFDLLNAGKASVALDLRSAEGVTRLRALLARADVVIEGSRPRALGQLGIDPEAMAAGAGPQVWVSITGHGREGADGDRVGFGDDAAAGGGLVVWDDRGPCFLADAVADPLTGIAAMAEVERCLAQGGAWLLDAALARVAAAVAGGRATGRPVAGPVPRPRSRPVDRKAAPLGADTAAVLAELT